MTRAPRGRSGSGRDFPRTARLNELLREIIAETMVSFDDSRLENVSITAVSVDRDLNHAVVAFDTLVADSEDDAAVVAALEEHRIALKSAIGRQARLRRTPELSFRPDETIRSGERIDVILRNLDEDRAQD